MSSISPGLRAALLERLLRDRAAGTLRPCEEYARAFPGFEAIVEQEYARFTGAAAPPADPATSGFEAAFARARASGRVASIRDYLRDFPEEARRIADRFAELDAAAANATAITVIDVGARLGPYRVLELIGRGGQGDVFLAEDTRLHRNIALKVLRPELVRRAGALERFRREAAYASRLDHPGICSVYEADTIDGAPFVAMRYVEGETLAARIRRERKAGAHDPSPADLLARAALIEQAARAVQAAHDAGVLHRDLKPANLVVTPEGRPVLLDFGLAHADESGDATLTGSGDLFGTPAYMSPEQAAGAHGRVDARTDVWALGVTLYELLTLEPPFQAPSRGALLRRIEQEDPADPRAYVPRLPRDLAAVVLAALEKDPQRRYRSAAALADDLQAFCEGRSVSVVVPGPIDRARRFARREPAKAFLAVALVLALLAAAGSGGYVLASRGAIDVGAAELERREAESVVLSSMGFTSGRHQWTSPDRQRELLIRNPHLVLVRTMHLDGLIDANRADEALAWTRMPPGVTATLEEEQVMRRMRIAALQRLGWSDEAKREEADLAQEPWPVEQFAAGLLEYHRVLAGDKSRATPALDHLDRAIFLSRRAEFIFHLVRARVLTLVYRGDPGRHPQAKESARALITLWPDDALALIWAAQLTQVFDIERAAALARHATEIDPLFPEAFVLWSFAELQMQHREEAERIHRAGVAAAERGEPTRTWIVHHHWGTMLLALEDVESAIAAFMEAVRLAPDQRSASRSLGRALKRAERLDELTAELRRRVEVAPTDGLAWLMLAHRLDEDGELAAARAAAERAHANRERFTDDPDWFADLDRLREELRSASGGEGETATGKPAADGR